MQITDVRQHHLSHHLEGTFEPTWIPGYPQGSHEVELFEIETDAGITGYAASPSFAGGESTTRTRCPCSCSARIPTTSAGSAGSWTA